jgi:hypothetical protein
MTNRTIEIVSFKLNDGVKDEDFIAAAHAITDFAKSCDGFITRNLSKNDDGRVRENQPARKLRPRHVDARWLHGEDAA